MPSVKSARLSVLGSLAIAAALVLPTASVSAAPRPSGYVCTGGEIGSGTYASLTVAGMCSVAADANITVLGNINVEAGAMLDAQSAPSAITVGHNVTAAVGSMLGLGCQPPSYTHNSGHTCAVEPDGHSMIIIHGNVTATDAALVMLNGVSVAGNVALSGGGMPAPWSIKNNMVGGNIAISGVTAEWVGVMFNKVGKNVTLTDITVNDVDPGAPGVYVVRNNVAWNLICTGLTPGVSGGFIPGEVNTVGRKAIGQCASLV